jgi:outer membrane protein assembly factor BamB
VRPTEISGVRNDANAKFTLVQADNTMFVAVKHPTNPVRPAGFWAIEMNADGALSASSVDTATHAFSRGYYISGRTVWVGAKGPRGDQFWRCRLDRREHKSYDIDGDLVSPFAGADGRLYFQLRSGADGVLASFDTVTGKVDKRSQEAPGKVLNAIRVDGEYVYGVDSNYFQVFRRNDLALAWACLTAATVPDGPIVTSGNTLVFWRLSQLLGFQLNASAPQKELWEDLPNRGDGWVGLAPAAGFILAATENGEMRAIDPATGKRKWAMRVQPLSEQLSTPVKIKGIAERGVLVVGEYAIITTRVDGPRGETNIVFCVELKPVLLPTITMK